jgi:hypothetical protein
VIDRVGDDRQGGKPSHRGLVVRSVVVYLVVEDTSNSKGVNILGIWKFAL